jgi:hypothetical protein
MRPAAAVAAALLVGVVLGAVGSRVLAGEADRPAIHGGGVLRELPEAPVDVRFETVRLAAGFRSRHVHGGPTLNILVSGRIEIRDADGTRVLGPGDSFFEAGGRRHSIAVLETARLDVVRLVPPGAEATTEIP